MMASKGKGAGLTGFFESKGAAEEEGSTPSNHPNQGHGKILPRHPPSYPRPMGARISSLDPRASPSSKSLSVDSPRFSKRKDFLNSNLEYAHSSMQGVARTYAMLLSEDDIQRMRAKATITPDDLAALIETA